MQPEIALKIAIFEEPKRYCMGSFFYDQKKRPTKAGRRQPLTPPYRCMHVSATYISPQYGSIYIHYDAQ